MAVTIICPNLKCRSILQVPEATRGRSVRCGKCGSAFLVPEKKGTVSAGVSPAGQEEGGTDSKKGKKK